MEDLQTINDIINSAVKNSSYITAIISSCVFILYTLIIKVVDLYKSKDKQKGRQKRKELMPTAAAP